MVAGSKRSTAHVLFLPSFYSDPDKPLVGSFFKEQAQAVRKAGLKVGVAYVEPRRLRALRINTLKENHGQITSGEEDGLPTMRLRGWNPHLQSAAGGLIWSRVTRFLVRRYVMRLGRPDVIHAHNAHWAGFAAYQVWRHLGIPYVVTEHSGGFLTGEITALSKRFARKVYRHASKVIVVSQALGDSIEPLLDGRTSCVVPNCVDTDFFSLPPTSPSKRSFVFLAVAHLMPNKGIDVLLRAFTARFRGGDKASLRIGGDGPIRNELMSLCEELAISHKVQFLGALSREGVRAAMWDADALVLPSFHETFGVVLIEAMSTGLPVIASRSGGPDNIVTSEIGILVEPGNVKELSEAMNDILGRRFVRSLLRDRAVARYAQSVCAGTLRKIYGDVESRRLPSASSEAQDSCNGDV
jgi:glycosyltransferase involved in cell wall biosynthesis